MVIQGFVTSGLVQNPPRCTNGPQLTQITGEPQWTRWGDEFSSGMNSSSCKSPLGCFRIHCALNRKVDWPRKCACFSCKKFYGDGPSLLLTFTEWPYLLGSFWCFSPSWDAATCPKLNKLSFDFSPVEVVKIRWIRWGPPQPWPKVVGPTIFMVLPETLGEDEAIIGRRFWKIGLSESS